MFYNAPRWMGVLQTVGELGCVEDIDSRISRLNMNNLSDVVWIYKNILRIHEHSTEEFDKISKMMNKHKPFDFNTSSMILEEIRTILQMCFDTSEEDEEINFVIERCGTGVKRGGCTTPMWCVDRLYKLVLPFSRICAKQVVDIVAFLFTRTTVAEFDDLFEIFSDKKDFLVELNLLKIKLMRERKDKYRCEKCMKVKKDGSENICFIEESIKELRIAVGGSMPVYKSKVDDVCDDENDLKGNEESHLVEGHGDDIISNTDDIPMDSFSCAHKKPFVDDVSFVCEEVSHEGNGVAAVTKGKPPTSCSCSCTSSALGHICLCGTYDRSSEERCLSEAKKYLFEMEKVSPKFFLENITLYLSLAFDEELLQLFRKYIHTEYRIICASNVFRLCEVSVELVESMVKEMKTLKEYIFKTDGLLATSTTFRLYIDWCNDTFHSVSISSARDYVEISKIYAKFLREFKSKGMFCILLCINACKIEEIVEAAQAYLMSDLKEIIETFLKLFGGFLEDGDSWTKEICSLLGFNISDVCVKKEFEKMITETHKRHRKIFLSQIGVLEHFCDEFKSKIVLDLCSVQDMDWRYRRSLLHSYREHPHLFKSIDIVNTLTRDRVFIVRRTALDIREEESNND